MFANETAAHQFFSADFFGKTWELLEQLSRNQEDDERMISLAHASLAHWRMREDCTDRHLSIGYWQISRVHAVLGQAENAHHYGALCLAVSSREPVFFLGYAHEALARAAKLAGEDKAFHDHLESAQLLAEQVEDAEEKAMLMDDLNKLTHP